MVHLRKHLILFYIGFVAGEMYVARTEIFIYPCALSQKPYSVNRNLGLSFY
jgi:hypothetical protein